LLLRKFNRTLLLFCGLLVTRRDSAEPKCVPTAYKKCGDFRPKSEEQMHAWHLLLLYLISLTHLSAVEFQERFVCVLFLGHGYKSDTPAPPTECPQRQWQHQAA